MSNLFSIDSKFDEGATSPIVDAGLVKRLPKLVHLLARCLHQPEIHALSQVDDLWNSIAR